MSLSRRCMLSTLVFGGTSLSLPRWGYSETPGIQATFVLRAKPATGRREPPVITCLSAQKDGDLLAVGGDDHLLRVWNHRTGELVHALAGHHDWIRAIAFVPDKDQIVTAGNDRRLLRWTLAGEAVAHRELARHQQAIASVSLDHQGARLAASGFEPTLSLYNLTNTNLVSRVDCPCRDMRATVFSPTGQTLASAGRNGRIRLWTIDDLKHVRDIQAHKGRVRALAFSPDGTQLVSASEDRTARIWSVTTGEQIAVLDSTPAKVFCAAYLNDRYLATGGSDNVIRIWDVVLSEEVHTLAGHTGSVAALSTSGTTLISGSFDTTVRVWHPLGADNQALRRTNGTRALK